MAEIIIIWTITIGIIESSGTISIIVMVEITASMVVVEMMVEIIVMAE